MIRLIQRRLIIPRGDTGDFTVPVLDQARGANCIAVFSIFDLQNGNVILQKEIEVSGDTIKVGFEHDETTNLPLGRYVWDIKIYINPERKNNKLINGDEVHSYYAGFEYPICEITLARDRR